MPLMLTRDDVAKVLTMPDCIDVVEKACAELSDGTAVLPLRIPITPPDGLSLYMPAYLKEQGVLACKVVTVYKNNPDRHGLPVVIGKVLVQDPASGDVDCIMDGGYLTAVRTGAASGVATKYLARPDDGQIVSIFGGGVQAEMQLEAVACVRKLSKAIVYDISEEAAKKFSSKMGRRLDLTVDVAVSPDQALEADIICAATSSPTPIFDGSKVKEGTHINGIGSHTPNARELDTEVVRRSTFIADSTDACLAEAGDIMIPIETGELEPSHIKADLGEIVTGRKPGRQDASEITLFKSNGLAIQDVATAKLVYDKALAAGIGQNINV